MATKMVIGSIVQHRDTSALFILTDKPRGNKPSVVRPIGSNGKLHFRLRDLRPADKKTVDALYHFLGKQISALEATLDDLISSRDIED